jgi:hypothetical protein
MTSAADDSPWSKNPSTAYKNADVLEVAVAGVASSAVDRLKPVGGSVTN